MEKEVVVRRDNGTPTMHRYPFENLPLLKSHLHPKFAIFDAGRKLLKLDPPPYLKLIETFPSLSFSSVQDLYTTWTHDPPTNEAPRDQSYNVPNKVFDEGDFIDDFNDVGDPRDGDYVGRSNKTNQTGSVRIGYTRIGNTKQEVDSEVKPTAVKRKHPHPNRPTRKVFSEWYNYYNRQLLSELTLSSINRGFGETACTDDRIRDWLKTLPKRKRLV